jgi:hypothetical protein
MGIIVYLITGVTEGNDTFIYKKGFIQRDFSSFVECPISFKGDILFAIFA